MRINFFKLRKNRRFNYTPRYFEGKTEENPYDFDSRFSKFRDTANVNDFGAHWKEARLQQRNRRNRGVSLRLLLIILLLVLISLYVLDFDLSIFKTLG